ncbi:MAG: type II and III secretion system protein family protein [Pseudomonadota bacterium]
MIGGIVRAVCLALLAVVTVGGAVAEAQSVLRVQRGLASNDILVLVNRAVVVESTQPFTELSVAQPEISDVQPLSDRSIYVLGRRLGKTTLTLLGEGGRLISNVTIQVQADLSELKARLKAVLPEEDVEVRQAGGGIVMSGVVSGKDKIDRALTLARAYAGNNITNMMTVGGTQQVALKVRVAEMSRSAAKDIGVSVGFLGQTNRTAPFAQTGPGGVDISNVDGSDGLSGLDFTNVISAFGTFGSIFAIADNFLLDVQLDALEAKGFMRMLAEPTVVALSGAEADFLAGGEVPIPAIDDEGNVDVDFRAVGVNVIFRPTVLDGQRINLALSAEVSSVDPSLSTTTGGIDIVGFQVRRATTTIEMRDGQSFAIAGLFEEDFANAVDQVPFLGDVPILGTLFRSSNFQRNESELVIMVTANLVTPLDNEEDIVLPTDRIGIPNEFELFLLGNTVPGDGANLLTTQGFDGDYGYVVE